MIRPTLNRRLVFAVLGALVPIAVFSFYQAIGNSAYSRQLIADRLAVNALAEASSQHEPILAAQRMLMTLMHNPDVINNTPKCAEVFRENLVAQQALVNIVWSDAAGNAACSAIPATGPVSYAQESWWKRGVETRKFTISAPTIGPISRRRVIIAMQPLFTSNGNYVGAISTGISLSWIEKALRNSELSEYATVGVADSDGKMLLIAGPGDFGKVDVAHSFGSALKLRGKDGKRWLYSSAPLYEDQLHVVYAELENPLVLPLREQVRAGIVWPLLAIMLTLFAVWAGLNRLVLRWLDELGALTRQFAAGDYTERRHAFAKAPPEIAEVGNDLHAMAQAITQRNEALEASLATTRQMAREVNHRVKNNLQMIMSLLALQSAQVKEDEARRVLDQTRVRMAALSLIHRLLYENSDDAERGEVDMSRVFSELCSQLNNSMGLKSKALLQCTAKVGNRPIDEAIPLALFAVEAISNAYRHAFPSEGAGVITSSLVRSDSGITLTIADNGVGYDTATIQNMMGMDLIHAFVLQLEGKLDIQTGIDQGVSLSLSYSPNEARESVLKG
ncbi:MAG: histidine kinase dimerization/phosphoacceptor domain -containing protein [Sphingorhabdus sp.]